MTSKTAVEWRQVGNKSFQHKKYEIALESYTQSVLVATHESLVDSSSKYLALAYANRSAALFYMKEYKVCLQDIELALDHGYPSNLMYKLYQRRGLCMVHLGQIEDANKVLQDTVKLIRENSSITEEKRASLDEELQKHIESCGERNSEASDKEGDMKTDDEFCESEMIANASQAVSLKYEWKRKGRHLVAKCDIPAGSDVIRELPYALVLLPDHHQNHCHYCCKQLIAPIPCAKCVWAVYCSKQCLQSAWKEHHMVECPHRQVVLKLGAFAWLSLRMMLHSNNEENDDEEESRHEDEEDSDEIDGCESDGSYKAQYRSVNNLMAHSFDQPKEEVDSYKPKAACIMKYFGDHLLQNSDNHWHVEETSAKLSKLELDSKSDDTNKALDATEQRTSDNTSDKSTSVDKGSDLTPKALNEDAADCDKADTNRTLDATEHRSDKSPDKPASVDKGSVLTPKALNEDDTDCDKADTNETLDATEHRSDKPSDKPASVAKGSDLTPKAQNQDAADCGKAFDSMDQDASKSLETTEQGASDKSSNKTTSVDKGSDLTPKAQNQDDTNCGKAFDSMDRDDATKSLETTEQGASDNSSDKTTSVDKGSDRIFKAMSMMSQGHADCDDLLDRETTINIVCNMFTLQNHMKQLKCNAIAITAVEPVNRVEFTGRTDPRGRLLEIVTTEQVRLATAVYPTASLMNHSCDPNVIASFNGRQLIVRAIKTIRAGEEILHCYGPHVKRMDTASRRKALQEQYFFVCSCTACESDIIDSMRERSSDWSNVYRCWNCESPIVLKGNDEKQKCNSCNKDINSQRLKQKELEGKQLFTKALGRLHWNKFEGCLDVLKECLQIRTWALYKYHKDIAETQDCMARCYASLGNHAEAGKHLSSSLVIVEKIYGEESIEVANELQKLAQIYFNGKLVQKAQDVIDRALRLFTLHYGKTHEAVQELTQMKQCLILYLSQKEIIKSS